MLNSTFLSFNFDCLFPLFHLYLYALFLSSEACGLRLAPNHHRCLNLHGVSSFFFVRCFKPEFAALLWCVPFPNNFLLSLSLLLAKQPSPFQPELHNTHGFSHFSSLSAVWCVINSERERECVRKRVHIGRRLCNSVQVRLIRPSIE